MTTTSTRTSFSTSLLQTARWNAVQKAKRRELLIRGLARELGIHRDTAKKYMEAVSPPMNRSAVRTGWSDTLAPSTSDIFAGQLDGHLSWPSTAVQSGAAEP